MRAIWNWLRDSKNLAVLAAIGAAVAFLWGKFDIQHEPRTPDVAPTPSDAASELERRTFLNEDQVRGQISKALLGGEVERAVLVLGRIADGEVKREECQRVFSFCIKNDKLNEAKGVVDKCWSGEKQKQALAEIELASLKEK